VITPLTSEPDAVSKCHFSEMMNYHVEGKRKLLRVISKEAAHILEAFSEEGLKARLPENRYGSVNSMRLRYIRLLISRFSNLGKLNNYFKRVLGSFVRIG
jgi:hypothetical protein